ncbi:MAG: hypothetical protein MJ072_03945, partial [Clostridia bacterium]|nr:hypothetical protein [Clostridia bacterium]
MKLSLYTGLSDLDVVSGYGITAGVSCIEYYVKKAVIPTLNSYAHKYLGISSYKECNFVDKNGILIKDQDVIEDMIYKGEDVNLLLQDARYMVPVKINKWATPVPTKAVPSPFHDLIEKSKAGLLAINKKLPDELKMKFGSDGTEEDIEEKLSAKFEKSFLDPEKVRLHLRAKAYWREVNTDKGVLDPDSGKRVLVFDSLSDKELLRVQEKYGPVPADHAYFGRAIQSFLKTDGSLLSQEYNDALYASYVANTDEARTIFENAVKKMLSVDFRELNEALKTDEGTMDYCEKHFLDIQLGWGMSAIKLGNGFTPEFTKFLNDHKDVLETMGALNLRVNMMAQTAYMADVYNEEAFKDNRAQEYLYNFTETAPKEILKAGKPPVYGYPVGATEYRIRSESAMLNTMFAGEIEQLAKDAERFPGKNLITEVKSIDKEGQENRRRIGEGELVERKAEEHKTFDAPVVKTGKKYTTEDEY